MCWRPCRRPAEDAADGAAAAAAAAGGGGLRLRASVCPRERARRVLPARRASPLFGLAGGCALPRCGIWSGGGSAALGRLPRFGAEVLVVDPRGAVSVGAEADAPQCQRRWQAMSGSRQRPPTPHALPGARRMSPLPRATRAMRRRASCSRHLVAGALVVAARAYREGDEEGLRARRGGPPATGAVNRRIGERCRERGIPVSVADAPEEGTFFFPALCEGERLVAGIVSRDGAHADHALVARGGGATCAASCHSVRPSVRASMSGRSAPPCGAFLSKGGPMGGAGSGAHRHAALRPCAGAGAHRGRRSFGRGARGGHRAHL